MSNEPFADYLNYLITSLVNKTTFVNDPDNVIIGETADVLGKPDDFFPRLETLITKMKDDGYIDQRMMDQSFRFSIMGYIRREEENTTSDDMFSLIKFARECKKIVYESNSDRANGDSPCDGFMQVGGFTEVFLEYEQIPKHSAFLLEAEVEIQLADTYTNN